MLVTVTTPKACDHGATNESSNKSGISPINVFALRSVELTHLQDDISIANLIATIRGKPDTLPFTELASDGVIRLNFSGRGGNEKFTDIGVHIVGTGHLGTFKLDQEIGEITEFKIRTNPARAIGILSKSPSAIAIDLIRKIDATTAELPETTRTVIEVFEDEGVVVDSKGNGIILSVNRHHPEAGAKVIGIRANAQVIQTGGQDTCNSLLGTGTNYGFLFHATSSKTFEPLAASIGGFLARIDATPEASNVWLVKNTVLAFEFGDLDDQRAMQSQADQFVSVHLRGQAPCKIFNSSSCCLHVDLRRHVAQLIPLL